MHGWMAGRQAGRKKRRRKNKRYAIESIENKKVAQFYGKHHRNISIFGIVGNKARSQRIDGIITHIMFK